MEHVRLLLNGDAVHFYDTHIIFPAAGLGVERRLVQRDADGASRILMEFVSTRCSAPLFHDKPCLNFTSTAHGVVLDVVSNRFTSLL